MSLAIKLTRLSLAGALLASLGACAVGPAYPVGYRAAPVYVESYPAYGYSGGNIQYPSGYRHYDGPNRRDYRRDYRQDYRQDRRGEVRQYQPSPLESAARTHRDIRRRLGLPRLPGMP